MYVSNKVEVRNIKKGKSLFALGSFVKDEVILEFEKNFLEQARRDTLCIDTNKHQYSKKPEAVENFLNHSCNPNGYINFDDLTFRAFRFIKKGEELTFNYLTTEWDMANKFKCDCGSKNCYGEIKGFKYLTVNQQKELKHFLSPFLKKKLKEIENQSSDLV